MVLFDLNQIMTLSGLMLRRWGNPICDNDELPVTEPVLSQCAPSLSGDWWCKRGETFFDYSIYV